MTYNPEVDPTTLIVFWRHDNLVGCLWSELERIDYTQGLFRPKGYGSNWGIKSLITVLPNSLAKPIVREMESLEREHRTANDVFRERGKMLREVLDSIAEDSD